MKVTDERPDQNIDEQAAPEPLIPWERRNKMSFFKAYFGTISYIVSMRNRLDEVIARPVCLRGAKKFRGTTVFLATIAWLVTVTLLFISELKNKHITDSHVAFFIIVIILVVAVFTYLDMLMTTGTIKWFFCPENLDTEMQDRAIALSYYTCGPLLTVLLSPILLGVGLLVLPYEHIHHVLWAIGVYNLLSFVGWYKLVIDAVHSTTGRKMKRTILSAIGVPIVVIGIPILLGVIPAALAMWVMLYYSVT